MIARNLYLFISLLESIVPMKQIQLPHRKDLKSMANFGYEWPKDRQKSSVRTLLEGEYRKRFYCNYY